MTTEKVVTRFAPSPTGALHVGGARTALFNWAFARHFGGQFILRIEDTDVKRSTVGNTRGLIRDLRWLGLDWDQGPAMVEDEQRRQLKEDGRDARPTDTRPTDARATGARPTVFENQTGDNGPYFQSQRSEIYQSYLEKLQSKGLVYEDDGALRFKMPKRDITVHDLILGAVTVEADQPQIQDFIIYKSDKAGGGPTFHFANIIDDALMGITHVIRGQEHLNNTPKHLALAEALDLEPPQYGHIPLIFNTDGSKMSKRDKAKAAREGFKKAVESGQNREELIDDAWTIAAAFMEDNENPTEISRNIFEDFVDGKNDEVAVAKWFAFTLKLPLPEIEVDDFNNSGYLPNVLINYLALLGWNPGNDIEDFGESSLDFMKDNFTLERVQKAAAKFDRQKLLHFNGEGIANLSEEEFREKLVAQYDPEILNGLYDLIGGEDKFALFTKAYHQRSKTLNDPKEQGKFFWENLNDDDYDLTSKPVRKMLRDQDQVEKTLNDLQTHFDNLSDWNQEAIEKVIETYAAQQEIKMGKIAQPIRVAVAGGPVSPPIGLTLAILGKQKTLDRIGQFQLLLEQREDDT